MTGLPFEQPERVRSVLARWAAFPVGQRPRPLIFLDATVRGVGFEDSERKNDFWAGAVASSVSLPDGVFGYLTGHPSPVEASRLLITECRPVEDTFTTDRGLQTLSAYRLLIEGTLNACTVLDPAVDLWWPEPGHLDDMVPVPRAWIEPDDRTLHLHVGVGSTSTIAGVEFTEHDSYVQTFIVRGPHFPVSPQTVSEGRSIGFIFRASWTIATATLDTPLGDRVLVNQTGNPYVVEPSTRDIEAQSPMSGMMWTRATSEGMVP